MPLSGCLEVPPLSLFGVTRDQPALRVHTTEVMLRVHITQCRFPLQLRQGDPLVGRDDVFDHPAIGTRHELRGEAEGDNRVAAGSTDTRLSSGTDCFSFVNLPSTSHPRGTLQL